MADFKSGMVSVTFRPYSTDEVIAATVHAGLKGIEWGSDVHVPVGNTELARSVADSTKNAGLEIFSYGAYYHATPDEVFEPVLESAAALGAPNIRVWAGSKGSASADEEYRTEVTAALRHAAALCAEKGITLSVEYHQNTLTDTADSALRLVHDIDNPAFHLYWQPNQFLTYDENIAALKKVLPYVSTVHVFSWEGNAKFPLRDHTERWKTYVDILRGSEATHCMELEFSHDGSEEAFAEDAEFLRELIG